MPHIIIQSYHQEKMIMQINLHADVQFNADYFKTPKAKLKLEELQEKLENVIGEYFDIFSSDTHSNHEYNVQMKGYGR